MKNEEGKKRQVVVGVDGGGTKTLALAEGAEQGQTRGAAGSSNLHAVGFEAACAAIETAIAQAVGASEMSAVCLGLAGAGRPQDVERFTTWAQMKYPHAALKVVSDAEILLAAGALTGAALALVCGTGSIVYGRTARGELIRAGGWGYLFGDEGSGFALGAAALRAVTQAHDGRGTPTLLTDLILARRGVDNATGLVASLYDSPNPRAEIAGLAEWVEQAADQGDALALSILENAAHELTRMAAAVYHLLDVKSVPLILSGGVILNGARLAGLFRHNCKEAGLRFSSVQNIPEPATGAVLLARQ
jgi:N-acetylglucosamine kinase-like BadF-type ATPase